MLQWLSYLSAPSLVGCKLTEGSSGGGVTKCSQRGHEALQILLQSKVKKISLLSLYTSLSFEVKYFVDLTSAAAQGTSIPSHDSF